MRHINRMMVPVILLGVLLLGLPLLVSADLIVLENGDRLSGRILSADNGVLKFETELLGVVEIKTSQVADIRSETEHELMLVDGELIKGRLESIYEYKLQVSASDSRSESQVAWAQVAQINPQSVEEREAWRGELSLAGSLKSGNTDSRDFSAALRTVRQSERDRLSLKFRYGYGEEGNQRTAENSYAALKYDYYISKKFYSYLALEFLRDDFKDLNLRTLIGPGVGYQLLDEKERALAVEAGLAYYNDDRDLASDESWLSARFGVNLRYRLFDEVNFRDELLVYPSLEQGGEYQVRNEAGLQRSLGSSWMFSLTHIYEYDSQPAVGIGREDQSWLLGLDYAF